MSSKFLPATAFTFSTKELARLLYKNKINRSNWHKIDISQYPIHDETTGFKHKNTYTVTLENESNSSIFSAKEHYDNSTKLATGGVGSVIVALNHSKFDTNTIWETTYSRAETHQNASSYTLKRVTRKQFITDVYNKLSSSSDDPAILSAGINKDSHAVNLISMNFGSFNAKTSVNVYALGVYDPSVPGKITKKTLTCTKVACTIDGVSAHLVTLSNDDYYSKGVRH